MNAKKRTWIVAASCAALFAIAPAALADPIPPANANGYVDPSTRGGLSDSAVFVLGLAQLLGAGRSPRTTEQASNRADSGKTVIYEGGYCGVTEDGAPYTGVARYTSGPAKN